MQRDYIFFAGRRIAWRDSSGSVYYYFVDMLGSTRAVTDSSGNPCFNADYYPYGQENDYAASCSPTYKFTGYEYDSETGNYYAYARYYDPRRGRFMSPDPLGGRVGNPQSLNRYAYVVNNPTSFIDPLGMDQCPTGTSNTCVVVSGKPPTEPTDPTPPPGGDPSGMMWDFWGREFDTGAEPQIYARDPRGGGRPGGALPQAQGQQGPNGNGSSASPPRKTWSSTRSPSKSGKSTSLTSPMARWSSPGLTTAQSWRRPKKRPT